MEAVLYARVVHGNQVTVALWLVGKGQLEEERPHDSCLSGLGLHDEARHAVKKSGSRLAASKNNKWSPLLRQLPQNKSADILPSA